MKNWICFRLDSERLGRMNRSRAYLRRGFTVNELIIVIGFFGALVLGLTLIGLICMALFKYVTG